jgi:CheY-like chemotaxis protein
MSGELVSIRLLYVAAEPPSPDLWRQGAALASVPVEFSAVVAIVAAATLSRGGVDVCLVDSTLSDAERARVIAAARAAEPRPFIAACAPHAGERMEGVDRMLARPSSAEEARRLIELCLRVKIPTRVLVVDDSVTIRSIVRKILSASRFAIEVHEASEDIAALNQLRNARFGLVFLDYNMSDFNGFEMLSEIKRANPSVSVVMMTSMLDNAIADRAYAAGALAFLKKPFYSADVDALLERHFGLPATVS